MDTPKAVIVCGGREWVDAQLVKATLVRWGFGDGDVVISGTARGADRMGEQAAEQLGCEVLRFPARWDEDGRRAGFLRNERMLAHLLTYKGTHRLGVVGFKDGADVSLRTGGTEHMIRFARAADVTACIIHH